MHPPPEVWCSGVLCSPRVCSCLSSIPSAQYQLYWFSCLILSIFIVLASVASLRRECLSQTSQFRESKKKIGGLRGARLSYTNQPTKVYISIKNLSSTSHTQLFLLLWIDPGTVTRKSETIHVAQTHLFELFSPKLFTFPFLQKSQ